MQEYLSHLYLGKIILVLLVAALSACSRGGTKRDYAEKAGTCPPEMARIPGMAVCIDRYEAAIEKRKGKPVAVSKRGVLPAVRTSFLQAQEACTNAGKRICKLEEWDRACEGIEKRIFPYGNEFRKEACNGVDNFADPMKSTAKPTGSMPECKTPEGVFDLSGNVWEWTDGRDLTGTLRMLRGGGYSNKEEFLDCRTSDGAFQPIDEAYNACGFRCCKDL